MIARTGVRVIRRQRGAVATPEANAIAAKAVLLLLRSDLSGVVVLAR
jgi:hypothetical protein